MSVIAMKCALAADALGIPWIRIRADGIYLLDGSATSQHYLDMDAIIADPDNAIDEIAELYGLSRDVLVIKARNRRDQIQVWMDAGLDWSDMAEASQDQFMAWLFQQQHFFYVSLLYMLGEVD